MEETGNKGGRFAILISLASMIMSTAIAVNVWYSKILLDVHELLVFVTYMAIEKKVLNSTVILTNSGTKDEVIIGASLVFFKHGPDSEYFPKRTFANYFPEPVVIKPDEKRMLFIKQHIDRSIFQIAGKEHVHDETIYAGLNFIILDDRGFDFEFCEPFGQLRLSREGVDVGSGIAVKSVRRDLLAIRRSIEPKPLIRALKKILNKPIESIRHLIELEEAKKTIDVSDSQQSNRQRLNDRDESDSVKREATEKSIDSRFFLQVFLIIIILAAGGILARIKYRKAPNDKATRQKINYREAPNDKATR